MKISVCWGLPVPPGAQAAYGCRAILSGRYPHQTIDVVWDRQDAAPQPTPVAFDAFVNGPLSKWLQNRCGEKHIEPGGSDTFILDQGEFHARACANRSYGYLYVVAWTTQVDMLNKEVTFIHPRHGELTGYVRSILKNKKLQVVVVRPVPKDAVRTQAFNVLPADCIARTRNVDAFEAVIAGIDRVQTAEISV